MHRQRRTYTRRQKARQLAHLSSADSRDRPRISCSRLLPSFSLVRNPSAGAWSSTSASAPHGPFHLWKVHRAVLPAWAQAARIVFALSPGTLRLANAFFHSSHRCALLTRSQPLVICSKGLSCVATTNGELASECTTARLAFDAAYARAVRRQR